MNLDWQNLPFGYVKTDYNVRCWYRDGKWGEIAYTFFQFGDVDIAVVHQLHLAVGVEGLHLRIVVGGEIQQMLTVVVLAEGHCAVQREMMCLFSVFRHDC